MGTSNRANPLDQIDPDEPNDLVSHNTPYEPTVQSYSLSWPLTRWQTSPRARRLFRQRKCALARDLYEDFSFVYRIQSACVCSCRLHALRGRFLYQLIFSMLSFVGRIDTSWQDRAHFDGDVYFI